jgi:hypothetical protein
MCSTIIFIIQRICAGEMACGAKCYKNRIHGSDGHSVHALNNLASQFAANPSVVAAFSDFKDANALPILF